MILGKQTLLKFYLKLRDTSNLLLQEHVNICNLYLNLLVTLFIITMIKLLDADWLRRVHLFH